MKKVIYLIACIFLWSAQAATAQTDTKTETIIRGLAVGEALLTVVAPVPLASVFIDGELVAQTDASKLANINWTAQQVQVAVEFISDDGNRRITASSNVFLQAGRQFILDVSDMNVVDVLTEQGVRFHLLELQEEAISKYQNFFENMAMYDFVGTLKKVHDFSIFSECGELTVPISAFEAGGAFRNNEIMNHIRELWSLPLESSSGHQSVPMNQARIINGWINDRFSTISPDGENFGVFFPAPIPIYFENRRTIFKPAEEFSEFAMVDTDIPTGSDRERYLHFKRNMDLRFTCSFILENFQEAVNP